MHRFQLHKKNSSTKEATQVYALMNGVYFGGNDLETKITGIQCSSSAVNQKSIRLLVSDDGVLLSSTPSTPVKINGTMRKTSLTNVIVKHGDRIGIGSDDVFELIETDPSTTERMKHRSTGYPCYHAYNPMDELKTNNRLDCRYPNCAFACWCIADLNEHIRNADGHMPHFSRI